MIKTIFMFILIFPIRIYQLCISPFFPSHCRHTPTCSAYMIEAIKIHGPMRGLKLGCKRLMQCHPFGKFGHDPVPQKTCHSKSTTV